MKVSQSWWMLEHGRMMLMRVTRQGCQILLNKMEAVILMKILGLDALLKQPHNTKDVVNQDEGEDVGSLPSVISPKRRSREEGRTRAEGRTRSSLDAYSCGQACSDMHQSLVSPCHQVFSEVAGGFQVSKKSQSLGRFLMERKMASLIATGKGRMVIVVRLWGLLLRSLLKR